MLAKYTEEEVIQLAKQNPGYGLKRFSKALYPKAKKNRRATMAEIFTILEEYENETKENLFDTLQDPDYMRMVTESEYRRITERKYLPKGTGRTTGRRVSGKNRGNQVYVPLPPQKFNWGDIEPEETRDTHLTRNFLPKYRTINLRLDFPKFWKMHSDGYSRGEISRELEVPYQTIQRWVNDMIEFDESGVLKDWMETVEIVQWFSKHRGLSSYEEDRQDEVIMFIHSLIRDYILNPEDNEKPDVRELNVAYRVACESMSDEI